MATRAKKYSTKYFNIGNGKEIPVVVTYREESNGNFTYLFNLSEFKNLTSNFETKLNALSDKLGKRSFIVNAYKLTSTLYVEMENKTTTTVVIGDIYEAIRNDFADPLKNASSFTYPFDFSNVGSGMDNLKTYYVLPKTAIQVYENSKVADCFTIFLSIDKLGNAVEAQKLKDFLSEYLGFVLDDFLIEDYTTIMGTVKSYRINFFFSPKKISFDSQEAYFKNIDDKLIKDFSFPDFSNLGNFNMRKSNIRKTTAFDYVVFGMDNLEPYYELTDSKVQIYWDKKVRGCFVFFIPTSVMDGADEADRLKEWMEGELDVVVDDLYVDTFSKVDGKITDSYRFNFFFKDEKDKSIVDQNPSTAIQENLFIRLDAQLYESYYQDLVNAAPKSNAVPPASNTAIVFDVTIEEDINKVKKEIEQLIAMRSFLSPIDFERKIEFNQKIDDAQKRLNDLNFMLTDSNLDKDDIFDDLFEQSFTPILKTYNDVYASNVVNEQPASADYFTPNGSPSRLSDALNQLIRTSKFNEWFGNWQVSYSYRNSPINDVPCSTVITKDFEPLLVWHGTGTQFSYFRFDNFPAAYFAVTKAYSEWFADLHGEDGGYTIPFFLNIRNPLDLTRFKITKIKPKEFFDYLFLMTGMTIEQLDVNPLFLDSSAPPMETWVYLRNNPSMLKKIADNHVFDGIHFYESNPSVAEGLAAHSTEAFIIFNPSQCKIADSNRGEFMLGSLKSFLLKYGGKI